MLFSFYHITRFSFPTPAFPNRDSVSSGLLCLETWLEAGIVSDEDLVSIGGVALRAMAAPEGTARTTSFALNLVTTLLGHYQIDQDRTQGGGGGRVSLRLLDCLFFHWGECDEVDVS